jgi:hypothetical protein
MSRRVFTVLFFSTLLTSCGTNKTNDDTPQPEAAQPETVNGKVAKSVNTKRTQANDGTAQFSPEQVKYFLALGTKNLRDLHPVEKDKVATILWQQLLQSKQLVVARQICHMRSLEGDQPCQEVFDRCSAMLNAFTEEGYTADIKKAERGIRTMLLQTIKESEMPATDLELVFELYDSFVQSMNDFNCTTSHDDVENSLSATEKDFIAKHGDAKFRVVSDIMQRYLKPFLAPLLSGPNRMINIGK